MTNNNIKIVVNQNYQDTKSKKEYVCPRGHTFQTDSPIVIAVDNDPDYNTGPVCAYCYVDWLKVNLNADEVTEL